MTDTSTTTAGRATGSEADGGLFTLETQDDGASRWVGGRGQDHVRIRSLAVERLRLFADRQRAAFPADEADIHLIVGDGATGKTTLFDAVRLALYGSGTLTDRRTPIVPRTLLDGGTEVKGSLQVTLERGDSELALTRSVRASGSATDPTNRAGPLEAVDPATDQPLRFPAAHLEGFIPSSARPLMRLNEVRCGGSSIGLIGGLLVRHLEGEMRFGTDGTAAARRALLVSEGNRLLEHLTDRYRLGIDGEMIVAVDPDTGTPRAPAVQQRMLGGLVLTLAANHLHRTRVPQIADGILARLDHRHRAAVLELLATVPQQVIVFGNWLTVEDMEDLMERATTVHELRLDDSHGRIDRSR